MTPNKLVIFLILTSVIILRTSQGSSGANNGGKIEACAACKYQRRRCTPDCTFRPYFPAHRHQEFRNVHRLFGVRGVEKKLKEMPAEVRGDAMKSFIYQADMRSRFPAHGCCQIIRDLQFQIALFTAELLRTRTQIPAAAANFFDPATANFYDPAAANFFNPTAVNFFNPPATVESEIINPSRNLTANNDDFARVLPVNDGTIDFLSGGGHCCNYQYEECVTAMRPLERANNNNNNAQQFLPNSNNLGSSPGPANANENDFDFGFVAALEALEQRGGAPRNNDPRRELDDALTDEEISFLGNQDSGDKCADQSMTKDDDFPFP